jgi:hypothetical protein
MFITVDLNTIFEEQFVRMFTTYLHTKCYVIHSSHDPLVIIVKLKAEGKFSVTIFYE